MSDTKRRLRRGCAMAAAAGLYVALALGGPAAESVAGPILSATFDGAIADGAPPEIARPAAKQAAPVTDVHAMTKVLRVGATAKMSDLFKRIDYRLERVKRQGEVPRLFFASLPRDMSDMDRPRARKALFIRAALPLILFVNETIREDRLRIKSLRELEEAGVELIGADLRWRDATAEAYGAAPGDYDALLERVDIVPPSLAIAQAAEESGWGTSRFAREGNALFGQRIFRGRAGLVPRQRDKGKRHRVRAFDLLIHGVEAYVFNLNTHPAYKAFRAARAEMRRRGTPLDGYALAGALTKYSERRGEYVRSVRTIIRVNGLRSFDRVRLGMRVPTVILGPDA
jgi:Bax protein